ADLYNSSCSVNLGNGLSLQGQRVHTLARASLGSSISARPFNRPHVLSTGDWNNLQIARQGWKVMNSQNSAVHRMGARNNTPPEFDRVTAAMRFMERAAVDPKSLEELRTIFAGGDLAHAAKAGARSRKQ